MTHQLDSKNTSKCCNAPTVICEGTEWDVKDVRGGSTYYYGCTKCKEACDIVQPPNTEDVMELDVFIEELVSKHTSTVDKWLRNNKTIGEAYAEANREAKSKLTKYIEQQVLIGRKAELTKAEFVIEQGYLLNRVAELDRKISELKG